MPKDSTVSDLEELYKQAKTSRGVFEPTWFLNLAFFLGEQWLAWAEGRLYRPELRRSRITVVDNRILGAVRTEIAKMTKNRPVFVVTPRTQDEQDQNAAEMGDQLMRYLWKHLQMHEASVKALHWSRICSAGFLKTFWDPTIGGSVEVLVREDGSLLPNPQTGAPVRKDSPEAEVALQLPGVRVKRVAQGDIRVEVRSPFQMGIDPLADSFTEAEWVVEESVKSTEYVKQRYGVDVPADTPANPGMIEARLSQTLAPGSGGYKGVKLREYWSRPCVTHPHGRRAVWVTAANEKTRNGQILLEDDHPFDPMPYVMLGGIPVPGRIWPTCITEQLRGPQTELNKVKSQIAENRNRVGNPTIIASRQAVQDPNQFIQDVSTPGGVHFVDGTYGKDAVPTYLAAPPLPPYVVEEIQRIEESIEEISGQHEVTSAQTPPGVTAASAINLLQEADSTRLGPAIADYEVQLGRFGQKILKLAARYYTDPRTIRLVGDNSAFEIFDFRGSMLRDNTDVEVQAGSAFPESKAAKQAAMQDLLTFFVQSGNPPHGRQLAQFLKDWEVGGAERLIEDYTKNETQVNRENQKLLQGIGLPVNEYDDDEAHIDGHTDEQKSSRYEQAVKVNPHVGQVTEAHVALHRQRLDAQQQQQLQTQLVMDGKVPPNTTAAALQEEQQLSQLHLDVTGQQQQQAQQQAQAGQQQQGTAQKQGFDAAAAEQSQRHAEQAHQARMAQLQADMHRAAELHQQKLHQNDDLHEARKRQAMQPPKQGGAPSGNRRNAA